MKLQGRRAAAGVSAGTAAGMAAVMALVLSACGSSSSKAATSPATALNPSSATVVTVPPTTVSGGGVVPTVFNCGGGAFEPTTLLVTCGDVATSDVTTVMGAKWASWTGAGATGAGTVSARVDGRKVQGPASVTLSSVVTTENGPQFSSLLVTWTGSSPDGHPTDRFAVATAPH